MPSIRQGERTEGSLRCGLPLRSIVQHGRPIETCPNFPREVLAMFVPIVTAATIVVTLAANGSPTPRASHPAMPKGAAAGAANTPSGAMGTADLFRRADQNGNAVIDQGEWQSLQQSRFQRLDSDHNRVLSGVEMDRSGGAGGNRLVQLDANSDGAVSEQEFVSGQSQVLRRLDKDKDGALSTDEFGRNS